MVFAAGMGTRLGSLTANRPKALVEVEGRPLLEHVLNKLHRESVGNVVVNVHHFPDQIIDFINRYPYKEEMHIQVSDERTLLLDTGGGLRKALPLFLKTDAVSPILIHNVDILSNARLHELYNACRGHDAVLLVSRRTTSRYLLFDDEMKMVGWTNVQTGEVKSPIWIRRVATDWPLPAFMWLRHRLARPWKNGPKCSASPIFTSANARVSTSVDIYSPICNCSMWANPIPWSAQPLSCTTMGWNSPLPV